MESIQYQMTSPIGPLFLIANDKSLEGVYFKKQARVAMIRTLKIDSAATKNIDRTVKQLKEYFDRKRTQFDINLSFSGTPFQNKVWQQLARIPFGKTVSYKDIAAKINNPKAVRAVGTANGKNPYCIVVPCHRVIAADGTLGGFAGGLPVKRKLLELEQHA